MEKIKNPEVNKKLLEWRGKYYTAKSKYGEELSMMTVNESYYEGDKSVRGNPNSNKGSRKLAINVRNVCYELVESQVDTSIPMPKPFIVLATQNPVESESTFKLPAAQMDRFLIRLSIGYPDPKEEMNMLEKLGDEIPFDLVNAVCSGDDILQAQKEVSNVKLSARVEEYIVAIATATRNDSRLDIGASPRATRGLYKASKAYAALDGRDFVTPDDVKAICVPVLAHRLVLKGASRYSGVSAEEVLEDILNSAPVPTDILK